MPPTPGIEIAWLTKSYGDHVVLRSLDLRVPSGTVYALLGSNGAGKTTAIRILSTLLKADGGTATVDGHDVATEPDAVRASISLTGQFAAVDEVLTGRENLELVAQLRRVPDPRATADGLLARFGLTEAGTRRVATYSGGMRRRLDIAMSLIGEPEVLFLDEPTIGLDVGNRRAIWRHLAALRAQMGITIVLTTHYLEEAESCDRVGFIDHGRLVREGIPARLVAEMGEYIVEIETTQPQLLAQALEARFGGVAIEGSLLTFRLDGDPARAARLQSEFGAQVRALRWRRPNLNDVFLHVVRGEGVDAGRASRAAIRGVDEVHA